MKPSAIPLLRKALEDAEANPETTDLGYWAHTTPCGTTMCLAGRIITIAGHDIDWSRSVPDCAETGLACSWTTTGDHIVHVASQELDLTLVEARKLFYCDTLNEAWTAAEEITDGEITRPPRDRN